MSTTTSHKGKRNERHGLTRGRITAALAVAGLALSAPASASADTIPLHVVNQAGVPQPAFIGDEGSPQSGNGTCNENGTGNGYGNVGVGNGTGNGYGNVDGSCNGNGNGNGNVGVGNGNGNGNFNTGSYNGNGYGNGSNGNGNGNGNGNFGVGNGNGSGNVGVGNGTSNGNGNGNGSVNGIPKTKPKPPHLSATVSHKRRHVTVIVKLAKGANGTVALGASEGKLHVEVHGGGQRYTFTASKAGMWTITVSFTGKHGWGNQRITRTVAVK